MYDAFEAKDFNLCVDLYDAAKLGSRDSWGDEEVVRYVIEVTWKSRSISLCAKE